jgi:hypothetical protein
VDYPNFKEVNLDSSKHYLVTKKSFNINDIPAHWAFLIGNLIVLFVSMVEDPKSAESIRRKLKIARDLARKLDVSDEMVSDFSAQAFWETQIDRMTREWNQVVAELDEDD